MKMFRREHNGTCIEHVTVIIKIVCHLIVFRILFLTICWVLLIPSYFIRLYRSIKSSFAVH